MTIVAFLIARQRSGTGALGSVLDQHPEIRYVGEVFHPAEEANPYSYSAFLRDLVSRDTGRALLSANDRNFTDYIAHVKSLSDKPVVLVDVKYNSLHHFNRAWHGFRQRPRMLDLIREHEMPVVHLTRRNFIKTFVSGRLAEQNSVWLARSSDQLRHATLQVDIRQLLAYLRTTRDEVDAMCDVLRSYQPLLRTDYDELFDESGGIRSDITRKLETLLGVSEFEKRTPVFVKQTGDDLSTVIENIEEVKTAVFGTEFDWMLQYTC